MKKSNKVVFKTYEMNQLMLLPPSLEEFVPENHLVRVVNQAIEGMNIDPLLARYQGGGTSSYHPKMMLKVLVYAYSQKIYSSRQIAKALRENVHFMWLSGNNKPDFRTINRFRSSTMKGIIDDIFKSVLKLLIKEQFVKLESYFLDGTKIEANANRYTFVWGKAAKKQRAKLEQRIQELLGEIERANEEENKAYGDRDLEEMGNGPIDPEKLKRVVQEIDEKLKGDSKSKPLQRALKTLKGKYIPRLEKYEAQENILKGRNSYSKTDHDATFMRMKEDHMGNGQLKPGYNIQIGTENQFVVGYTIHPNPTDTNCLIPHLNHVEKMLGKLPENIVADAGYGSEENYDYLEKKGVNSYVKYNTFHIERTKKFKQDAFRVENFPYDEETDEFICPASRRLTYLETKQFKTEHGYETERRIYEGNCSECSLHDQCTKAKGNRRIQVSFRLNALKERARKSLKSDEGVAFRKRRSIEVEPVFGQIKNNRAFRRFMLRGTEKVKVEWGLLCIAHNISKMATC